MGVICSNPKINKEVGSLQYNTNPVEIDKNNKIDDHIYFGVKGLRKLRDSRIKEE